MLERNRSCEHSFCLCCDRARKDTVSVRGFGELYRSIVLFCKSFCAVERPLDIADHIMAFGKCDLQTVRARSRRRCKLIVKTLILVGVRGKPSRELVADPVYVDYDGVSGP